MTTMPINKPHNLRNVFISFVYFCQKVLHYILYSLSIFTSVSKTSLNPLSAIFIAVLFIGVFGLSGCFGYRALPTVEEQGQNPKQCAKVQNIVVGLLDDIPCDDCAQSDGIKAKEPPKKDKNSSKKAKKETKLSTQSKESQIDSSTSSNGAKNALNITENEARDALLAGLNDLCEALDDTYSVSLRYASDMTETISKKVFVATSTKQASVKVELEFIPDFFNEERKRFSSRANSQMEIQSKKVLEIGKNINIEPKDKAYLLRRAIDSAIKGIEKGVQRAKQNQSKLEKPKKSK